MSESISQLPLATQANATDLIPATQGSIGPGTGTTRAVTQAQIIAAGGTATSNLTLDAGGGWSSNNVGKQLLVTTPAAASNPGIGITDSNGANLWGVWNHSGVLTMSVMPAYSDDVTGPANVASLSSAGVAVTGTLSSSGALTVTSGGAAVTTGGITVSAGGAAITGNSSVTGALTVGPGGAAITGNSSVIGKVTVSPTATGSSPITVETSGLSVAMNGQPTYTANAIYSAATGAAGRTLVFSDAAQSVTDVPASSTIVTSSAVGGYTVNHLAGSVGSGALSALALWGVAIGAVDNSETWGLSTIVADAYGTSGTTTGTGRLLFGHESDFNITSPHTQGIGFFAYGTSLQSTAFTVGFQCGGFLGGAGATYTHGFVSADGAASDCLYVGKTAASGANLGSQAVVFNCTDGGSVAHTVYCYASYSSLNIDTDTQTLGTGNLTLLRGSYFAPSGGGYGINAHTAISGSGTTVSVVPDAAWTSIAFGNTTANLAMAGNTIPFADNTYSCGVGPARWTAVYAVNGAIQTSDPTLKTDIAQLPSMLPLIKNINPVTFRWIDGGAVIEMVDAEEEYHVTEPVSRPVVSFEVQNGVAVRVESQEVTQEPVFDYVPAVDANGAPIMRKLLVAGERQSGEEPMMHPIPRMATRIVQKPTPVSHEGRRTHWGFLAPDVKAAFDGLGMDFGGYVKAPDGIESLRPDQLIPVLWKAVQELAAEVASLKSP